MNETDYPAEYVAARAVLLDALLALEHHLPAIIVVGAQAVYLHTGAGEFVEPPMTTDGDLALDAASLGCEGERIWANHPRRYFDEFEHAADHRNVIGDPLLLPKKSDASYGDMTFGKKLPDFTAQAVLDRGTLYQQVAQHIWNPDDLVGGGLRRLEKRSDLSPVQGMLFQTARTRGRRRRSEEVVRRHAPHLGFRFRRCFSTWAN